MVLVHRSLPFGAGFKAFVQPEILVRTLAYPALKLVVHALGVSHNVVSREVAPGGADVGGVAVRLQQGDGCDGAGTRQFGKTRYRRHGSSSLAEKAAKNDPLPE